MIKQATVCMKLQNEAVAEFVSISNNSSYTTENIGKCRPYSVHLAETIQTVCSHTFILYDFVFACSQ